MSRATGQRSSLSKFVLFVRRRPAYQPTQIFRGGRPAAREWVVERGIPGSPKSLRLAK